MLKTIKIFLFFSNIIIAFMNLKKNKKQRRRKKEVIIKMEEIRMWYEING